MTIPEKIEAVLNRLMREYNRQGPFGDMGDDEFGEGARTALTRFRDAVLSLDEDTK